MVGVGLTVGVGVIVGVGVGGSCVGRSPQALRSNPASRINMIFFCMSVTHEKEKVLVYFYYAIQARSELKRFEYFSGLIPIQPKDQPSLTGLLILTDYWLGQSLLHRYFFEFQRMSPGLELIEDVLDNGIHLRLHLWRKVQADFHQFRLYAP